MRQLQLRLYRAFPLGGGHTYMFLDDFCRTFVKVSVTIKLSQLIKLTFWHYLPAKFYFHFLMSINN